MLGLARALGPGLGIAAATLAAALPWGLPADLRYLLAFVVMAVIHHGVLTAPSAVPEWLAFAAGLALDLLTSAPLGHWALLFLIGYGIAIVLRPIAVLHGAAVRAMTFAVAAAFLAGSEIAVSSLYFGAAVDAGPVWTAALLASLAYPLIAVVVRLLGETAPTARADDSGGR